MSHATTGDHLILGGLTCKHLRRNGLCWLIIATILTSLGGCASQGGHVTKADEIPSKIARIPDAVPKVEPLAKSGNPTSYVVFGRRYFTETSSRGFVERGLASWYGKPFHGRKTSSGEIYDMNAMTAAHKTLPLPTYARVTNMENGRSVVVRINDRGPFHGSRIIDLSYTAAVKLGVTKKGTAMVEVRAIDPRRQQAEPSPFLAGVDTLTSEDHTARAKQSKATQPSGVSSQPKRLAQSGPPHSRQHIPTTPLHAAQSATRATAQAQPKIAPPHASPPLVYLQVGAFGDARNAERLRNRLLNQHLKNDVAIIKPATSSLPLYKVRIGPIASEQDADRLSAQIAALGIGKPHLIHN